MAFGAFNGTLVAVFKIQPMVATLILYTAGRSIAAWINNNELPMISDPSFAYYGNFLPGVAVPTPIFIALACMILAWALLRFTNIGLYSQAVGINASAARLNGIHPQLVKFLTYVILGLCVAVAGFIKVSRFSTINYSVVAKDIEMDAILAVALGGNALSGGKFNIWASVLGAYVIQFLTTTLFKFNVVSSALPAYKAVVVIILVVLSAPTVREKLDALKKQRRQPAKRRRARMRNKVTQTALTRKSRLTDAKLLLIITICVFAVMYVCAVLFLGSGFKNRRPSSTSSTKTRRF